MIILQIFRCVVFANYILALTPSLSISVQGCSLLGEQNSIKYKKAGKAFFPSEKLLQERYTTKL